MTTVSILGNGQAMVYRNNNGTIEGKIEEHGFVAIPTKAKSVGGVIEELNHKRALIFKFFNRQTYGRIVGRRLAVSHSVLVMDSEYVHHTPITTRPKTYIAKTAE